MTGRLWIAALLVALTMACGEAVAPAPPVPVQESVVVVPAAQNDPDALPYLLSLNNEVGSSMDYRGVQSLESNILESDVIARVSYLRKQSSYVLRPDTSYYPWTAMLEFRFTVHEYLKGTGPAEIGGIVYMTFETEAQARAAAARIGAAHDSRWDSREAIVFLYSPSKEAVQTVHYMHWGAALPTTSDQYLFGRMFESPSRYTGEAYSVASVHRKLWLPAAETPSQGASGAQGRAQTPDDKLFLLDAPAHAGGRLRRGEGNAADDQPGQHQEQDHRPRGRGQQGRHARVPQVRGNLLPVREQPATQGRAPRTHAPRTVHERHRVWSARRHARVRHVPICAVGDQCTSNLVQGPRQRPRDGYERRLHAMGRRHSPVQAAGRNDQAAARRRIRSQPRRNVAWRHGVRPIPRDCRQLQGDRDNRHGPLGHAARGVLRSGGHRRRGRRRRGETAC